MKYYIFIIILFSIISCESDLTIDDSNFKKEVVVNSILSSDSTLTADLSYSSFFNDSNVEAVEDAQVSVIDLTSGRQYALIHSADGHYKNPNKGIKSHEYSLLVTTYDNKEMTAQTCIPQDIILDVSIDTLYDDERYINELSIGVEIANDPNRDNYYTFELLPYRKIVTRQDSFVVESTPLEFVPNDLPQLSEVPSDFKSKNFNLFSDIGYDGKNISTSFNFGRDDISFGDKKPNDVTDQSSEAETTSGDRYVQAYAIRIMAVSSDLFDYIKSYEIYNQQNNITSSNSQPGKIIFNIENGIGVFGGTNTQLIPIN